MRETMRECQNSWPKSGHSRCTLRRIPYLVWVTRRGILYSKISWGKQAETTRNSKQKSPLHDQPNLGGVFRSKSASKCYTRHHTHSRNLSSLESLSSIFVSTAKILCFGSLISIFLPFKMLVFYFSSLYPSPPSLSHLVWVRLFVVLGPL